MSCYKSIINNNWYVSFGDFLTLMLCFFLVLISNSFKKTIEKFPVIESEKKVSFEYAKDDLTFKLPLKFKDNIYLASLNNNLLREKDKINESYLLKLNNSDLNNNPQNIIQILNDLSLPRGYQISVLNLGNFKTFNDFLGAKRQLIDAKIDVSRLKMSHSLENKLILMIYKK